MNKPKKPDAPMMLASVEQAVRTLREWGWEIGPLVGKRGAYVAQKRRNSRGLNRYEIRRGKSGRSSHITTLAGEVLLGALLDDVRYGSTWDGLLDMVTPVALAHSVFRDRTGCSRELALFLSRILRDAYPDVADLLDVHANGGSL